MAFVQLDKTESDPGKSIKASWGDQVADNCDALFDWIGKDYAIGDNHNHDGANSAGVNAGGLTGTLSMDRIAALAITGAKIANTTITEGKLANSAVAAAKLKTTTSTVSHTGAGPSGSGANYAPTNSGYLFYPRFYRDATANTAHTSYMGDSMTLATTAASNIYLYAATNRTLYAEFRYVQASPPHAFGGHDDWGLFVFLLRNASTGEVVGSSVAEDPVWDGDWSPLPKGHPARIAQMPHPFADWYPYTDKRPEDHGMEIVLVDLHEQNAPVTRSKKASLAQFMANERQKHVALGVSPDELDAAEAAVLAAPDDNETMPAWRAVEEDAKAQGKTLPMLVTSGEWAPILATREIKEKNALPCCDRFRESVHVLRA
jgi:hypothetical protein